MPDPMPTKPVRIDDGQWRRFGDRADAAGTNRAEVIRALIRWWMREGPPPRRPDLPDAGRTDPQ